MVSASKLSAAPVLQTTLLQQMGGRDCRSVVHPWSDSCWRAPLRVVAVTLAGAPRLMLPAYVAQWLLGGWRPDAWSAARSLLRSLGYGCSICSGIVAFHCLFRSAVVVHLQQQENQPHPCLNTRSPSKYLVGGYTRSTLLFWPSLFAGFSIYVEDEKRRPITCFYFFTWVLEWLFRRATASCPAAGSRASVTLLFMAASGALMWTLRRGQHPRDMPIFWFFRPSRRSGDIEGSKGCPHQGTCWGHALSLSAKYAAVGVALQAGRALLSGWRGRGLGLAAVLARALRGTNSLALFLGAYVAIYQAVRCGLCRLRGEDRSAHALVAGVASGAALWLHPDLTIAFAAVATLIQLWVGHRCDRRLLEPASALCLSGLMHAALIDRRYCPSGFITLTDILAPGVVVGMHNRFYYLE